MRAKIKKTDQNLHLLINTLEENKIRYWVCHGTLLGIVRDKKLISWDHDIDIGVIENNINRKVLPLILKKKGFKQIKKTFIQNDGMMKFVKKGGREVDINFYQLSSDKKKVSTYWFIPKNVICKMIDVLANAKNYRGRFYKIIN